MDFKADCPPLCGGPHPSIEDFERTLRSLVSLGKIAFRLTTATQILPEFPACPVDFRLVSPHNRMSQFLKDPAP